MRVLDSDVGGLGAGGARDWRFEDILSVVAKKKVSELVLMELW